MNYERPFSPLSGYLMLVVLLVCVSLAIGLFSAQDPFGALPMVVSIFMLRGFFFINPNSSQVLVLFGEYKGTVKKNGFHWVNPFFTRNSISLRARNFDSEKIKVNDKVGNPIQIGVIL